MACEFEHSKENVRHDDSSSPSKEWDEAI